MNNFKNITDVLNFAIAGEERAIDFYSKLSNISNQPAMKKVFLEFAEEEERHKEKLVNILKGKSFDLSNEKIETLKISDYIVENDIEFENMKYQESLILAMKREKSAFKLYTNLAYLAADESIKQLFRGLAQEEAKHKLKFEIEYDEYFLKEN